MAGYSTGTRGGVARESQSIPPPPSNRVDRDVDSLERRLCALQSSEIPSEKKVTNDELHTRLNKLQGITTKPSQDTWITKDHLTDEQKIDLLVEEAFSQAQLDQGASSDASQTSDKSDGESFPWCCVCNQDASIRCIDCDDELFCKHCFRRTHNGRSKKKHATVAFKKKASPPS